MPVDQPRLARGPATQESFIGVIGIAVTASNLSGKGFITSASRGIGLAIGRAEPFAQNRMVRFPQMAEGSSGCRRFRVPWFSACSFGTRWGKLGAERLG